MRARVEVGPILILPRVPQEIVDYESDHEVKKSEDVKGAGK